MRFPALLTFKSSLCENYFHGHFTWQFWPLLFAAEKKLNQQLIIADQTQVVAPVAALVVVREVLVPHLGVELIAATNYIGVPVVGVITTIVTEIKRT